VVSIEAEVPQITYDFTGGGHYGVEKEVRTKEQADHSLPYMLAVALLDVNVMPAQFAPDRIIRADVQSLMKKVSAKPNQEYTDQYPRRMAAKITVRLQDGTTFQHEVQDYPGLASHPFTWEHRRCREQGDQGRGALARKHSSQRPYGAAWALRWWPPNNGLDPAIEGRYPFRKSRTNFEETSDEGASTDPHAQLAVHAGDAPGALCKGS
jgi:MmgE/PrpD C-terminal domain